MLLLFNLSDNRILIVLPTLDAGGAENYVLRFIQFVNNPKIDWYIVSVKPHIGDLHHAFTSLGCKVYYQPIGYINFKNFLRFYNLILKLKVNVLCTFTGNFGGVPITIAKLARVKKRIAWHRRSTNAFGNNKFKILYNKFVNRLIRMNATSIFSNSETAFANFYGSYAKADSRFQVLSNGVDGKIFKPCNDCLSNRAVLGIPLHKIVIGHVGRFDPAKNHETIFKVASILKQKKIDCIFLFCGKGTDSKAFSNLLALYEISDICLNIGLQNNLPLVYQSLDIFYFPSITEGQPNALLEAYACGLPVVSSNIPPILEVLPKVAHSLCLDPYAVEQHSEVLIGLLCGKLDKSNYQHREWVLEKFDFTRNLNKFLEALNK